MTPADRTANRYRKEHHFQLVDLAYTKERRLSSGNDFVGTHPPIVRDSS